MITEVGKYIESHSLFSIPSRLIIGVSGGVDSMVLLFVLKKMGCECIAAHCNFHLRGEESNRDEKLVRETMEEWEIPFVKTDFDTYGTASKKRISIEMAARELRYEWFEEVRKKYQAKAICIAHHQEDSIETMLLNLIRGTGIKGLTGIRPHNQFIVRPLLDISKESILSFAEDNNIPYVIDSTNLQDEFARNKIRLNLIPLLESINPSVKKSLLQTMDNLTEVEKIYEDSIQYWIKTVFNREKNRISISEMNKTPSSEAVLFEILKPFGFSREVILEIHRAKNALSGKQFYSPTHRLIKDRNDFILSERKDFDENESHLINKEDKIIFFPVEMQIDLVEKKNDFVITKEPEIAYLDADLLQFPLTLRKWKIGDKFMPLGMNGYQKLSDFFNNNKFNQFEKENVWVLVSGNDIVWLVNYRIDNRFRVKSSTKKILKLKVFR